MAKNIKIFYHSVNDKPSTSKVEAEINDWLKTIGDNIIIIGIKQTQSGGGSHAEYVHLITSIIYESK